MEMSQDLFSNRGGESPLAAPIIDWVGPGDKPTNSLSLEEADAREALHWAYFNALPTFPLRKTETPLGLRAGYPDRLADRAAGAFQFAALVRPVSASVRQGEPCAGAGRSLSRDGQRRFHAQDHESPELSRNRKLTS